MKFFEQKNTGRSWGTIAQVLQQSSIFITLINLALLAATAYNTTISPYLQENGISISFIWFMVIIALLLIGAMILIYKFALPSYFSAFNEQFYRHDNLLRKDIDELKRQNKEILKLLGQKENK